MSKEFDILNRWYFLIIECAVYLALIYWIIGGSIDLDGFFAFILTCIAYQHRKLKEQRMLFDIADRELVRVSALANSLEEEISTLKRNLEQA
jgi:hypothetical protein